MRIPNLAPSISASVHICRSLTLYFRTPTSDKPSTNRRHRSRSNEQCNITSADIVEVSVALAEARILEREGTALLSRQRQSKRGADHKLKKNRAGDPSSPPTTPPSSVTEGGKRTATTAAHPAAATASEEGGTDAIDCTWTTEKAAENKRRLALLSESLEASDVQDLQILRRSLERQADESASRPPSEGNRLRREGSNRSRGGRAGRSAGAAATTAASEVLVVGEDERWRADVLGERLAAVTRAVERKGGWRSAVFVGKDGGEVNVDVDAEPWPAAEGVLMLQTVKDALYVQLMEVRLLACGEERGTGCNNNLVDIWESHAVAGPISRIFTHGLKYQTLRVHHLSL